MLRPASLLVPALVLAIDATASAQDWPSFRGPQGSGVSATATPPSSWNVATSANVAWRTPIAGLGHSSPIVWGDRIYLTTAVSDAAASRSLTLGDSDQAGIDPAKDMVPHRWQVIALDRTSGKVVWTRSVHQGVPRVKRHVKGSHASATPATNGKIIVALLGSEGLVAFDAGGKELWRQDLGVMSVGLADDPTYEWGPASSPVIHCNTVVVQNDRYRDSFLIAFELTTGKELWRSGRNELPAWTTPLVHDGGGQKPTIVTNSPRFIRGHDLGTGRERWRLQDPNGEVKVSTPVAAGDLAIVTGGYPSAGRPIYAIRVSDGSVAWRLERGSPYTSTPLVHDGLLYIVTDNGILSAYQVSNGQRVYQQRLSPAGGFSASPIAAAGRLYLASEDGRVFVVRAGRKFELLAANDMQEVCMATPALSGDLLLIRTQGHLYALRGT